MTTTNTQQRGKLYIFLGYASGVGKTHRMLSEALHQQQLGKKIIVAYVESFAQAGYKSILDQICASESNKQWDVKIPNLEALVNQNPDIVLIDDGQAIVLHEHVYKKLDSWLFGRTSTRIIKRSPCPVIVITSTMDIDFSTTEIKRKRRG